MCVGEQMLDYVIVNEEITNIDMIWEIVDWFRQAAILTRGTDVELEAMALSRLGKVYDKVSECCMANSVLFVTALQ
jgi:hypothetical protein